MLPRDGRPAGGPVARAFPGPSGRRCARAARPARRSHRLGHWPTPSGARG